MRLLNQSNTYTPRTELNPLLIGTTSLTFPLVILVMRSQKYKIEVTKNNGEKVNLIVEASINLLPNMVAQIDVFEARYPMSNIKANFDDLIQDQKFVEKIGAAAVRQHFTFKRLVINFLKRIFFGLFGD